LMELTTRVDPLVTDLVNSANSTENSPEVVEAYLNALASVFASSGDKVCDDGDYCMFKTYQR
jgi:hypothetical protein